MTQGRLRSAVIFSSTVGQRLASAGLLSYQIYGGRSKPPALHGINTINVILNASEGS